MTLSQRRALTAYLLLLVPLAFFVFIRILPTLSALQVAFYQWDMLSDERPFVGLDNFQRLAGDAMFRAALGNTLKYVALGVPAGQHQRAARTDRHPRPAISAKYVTSVAVDRGGQRVA